MRRTAVYMLAAIGLAIGSSGCAVQQLHSDQDRIRSALLDLYTDQIMDNLVRAANGLPIIQLDYVNATALVTLSETASLNDAASATKTDVVTRAATAAAKSLSVTRTAVRSLTAAGGATNSNQVSLTASPVLNVNEVYDCYLEFLALPGSLMVTAKPPAVGEAHLSRRWGGQHYWVPACYRKQFLALALATTAQRGKALTPAVDFYEVTLQGLVDAPRYTGGDVRISVRIDRKVPNDTGRLELAIDGKAYSLRVSAYDPSADQQRKPQTDVLNVLFSPNDLPATVQSPTALPLQAAKLYLSHSRPPAPTTAELLDRMSVQLQQIQFNQLR